MVYVICVCMLILPNKYQYVLDIIKKCIIYHVLDIINK